MVAVGQDRVVGRGAQPKLLYKTVVGIRAERGVKRVGVIMAAVGEAKPDAVAGEIVRGDRARIPFDPGLGKVGLVLLVQLALDHGVKRDLVRIVAQEQSLGHPVALGADDGDVLTCRFEGVAHRAIPQLARSERRIVHRARDIGAAVDRAGGEQDGAGGEVDVLAGKVPILILRGDMFDVAFAQLGSELFRLLTHCNKQVFAMNALRIAGMVVTGRDQHCPAPAAIEHHHLSPIPSEIDCRGEASRTSADDRGVKQFRLSPFHG